MPHDTLPAPTRTALVADLFCGAGGSSTGARRALLGLGYRMDLCAVNHWPLAIESHSRNHPEARHYCQDVNVAKPIELVPEGKLDLLMASPSCTYHSRARGGKPINDQQRMDPWAIIHWCTELRIKRLIVENVPEFVRWGRVNLRTGRPSKRHEGEYFLAWVNALRGAGFKVEWRVLNAADFGDATTRERFFLMARSDGKRIVWPTPTHSRKGAVGDLLGHATEKWRAAREIIDWSLSGKSIFDRKRPLSPKTLARIYAGAVKFKWPDPFLVILRNHMDAQSIDEPVPAICAGGTHIALAVPMPFTLSNSSSGAARSVEDPLMTITTGGASNERRPGCARPAVVEPFILNRHGDNGATRAHPLDEPMPTADCRGAGYMVEPTTAWRCQACGEMFTDRYAGSEPGGLSSPECPRCGEEWRLDPFVCGNRTNNTPKSVDDPVGGITTTTGGGQFLCEPLVVEPFIATLAHGNPAHERDPDSRRCRSLDDPLQTIHAGGGKFGIVEPFVSAMRDGNVPSAIGDPVPALTTKSQIAVVQPFVLSQASCGAPRSVDQPVPTITTGGHGGAHALIAPYYGSGSGETCGSTETPLPTVTTKARFGLVVPVTNSTGGPGPRAIDDPLPTMTTAKGGEFALVMPVTHGGDKGRVRSPDDPLPTITAAPRGELAFIAAAFGERPGQAPRVHSIDDPAPTICAAGRVQLVEGAAGERRYDIRFRMLDPKELARAMGFSEGEIEYEFVGTKTEITKQIGNAVPVNTACALVTAIMGN
jgi:DNA (cytosine-5)-methyltransferase 1